MCPTEDFKEEIFVSDGFVESKKNAFGYVKSCKNKVIFLILLM